jgi:predicted DNA-binding transcriptional regulator AlpA
VIRSSDLDLSELLIVPEVAVLLRTTPKAIYMMIARRQLPGVVRINRRLLVRRRDLLDWLRHKVAPSPEELRR